MKITSTPSSTLTLIRLLKRSTSLLSASSIHSHLLKLGSLTKSNTQTANHLMNAYIRSHHPSPAHQLFEEMSRPDVISFTSLMSSFVASNQPSLSLRLFTRMPPSGVSPNNYTFATAITACSQLAYARSGSKLHAVIETLGLHADLAISTALIGLYTRTNDVISARIVFDAMKDHNYFSWASMISGYSQNAEGHHAILMFSDFLARGLRPNEFILSSILNACASVGRLGPGKLVHAKVIRCLHEDNEVISGSLIDMYSKCGCIEYPLKVFDRMQQPSLVPYTSMIMAAAKFGLADLALKLFGQMPEKGLSPNDVTFVGVLHACSHAGLVDEGLAYLDSMRSIYGIAPSAKHYTCAVDMLGRAGRVDEAYEIVKGVSVKGEDELMLLCSLLSASRIHKRLDIVAEAGVRLREFDRDVAGAYVAMSNAYVSVGEWEGAMGVQLEMRRRGIRKERGCSWVEVKDVAYVFYAGEFERCERGMEVVALLKELNERMEERGYVRGRMRGRSLIEEGEEADLMIGVHSEMLALGFGLLSFGEGVTIRVMKNLRMCGDCHEAFKVISNIVGREFVVRDLNRFHQFKHGSCSCGDYW